MIKTFNNVTIQHLKFGNKAFLECFIPGLWAVRDAKASCPPKIIHKMSFSEQAPCLIFYELSQVLNSYTITFFHRAGLLKTMPVHNPAVSRH